MLRSELQDAVNSIQRRFEDWKDLLDNSNTASNGNFRVLTEGKRSQSCALEHD